MSPIHNLLELVAKTIDGELFEYEDGYIIEIKNPTLWLRAHDDGWKAWGNNQGAADLDAVAGVKILFNTAGEFETIQYR